MGSKSFSYLIDQIMRFDLDDHLEDLFTRVVDSRWLQRLRQVYQTGCSRFVFPFSENSRFGHSIQSAYLMHKATQALRIKPQELSDGLILAALLHDIGHLAPGSHLAWKIWFDGKDDHERVGSYIIASEEIRTIFPENLFKIVLELLSRDQMFLPEFAYQLLHGEVWNVDRGSWIYSDAILSGLGVGIYNIDAIIDSLIIDDGALMFKPKRAAAVLNFLVSRSTMYQQVFFHPKVLSAEVMLQKIVSRARHRFDNIFVDNTMACFLTATSWRNIGLEQIYQNNEAWFHYHLTQWGCQSSDLTLKDLCTRFLTRRLFKYKIVNRSEVDTVKQKLEAACASRGLDPKFYIAKLDAPRVQLNLSSQLADRLSTMLPAIKCLDYFSQDSEACYVFFPDELSPV